MPPKPKFTKEEIIAAALDIVSERGMEALTARDLGARLGSSARPIFTIFRNMEQLQQEVRRSAMERFEAFSKAATGYTPAFKQFGMQMILFAKKEPKLFQLLFMAENEEAKSFEDVFDNLGETAELCIEVIKKDYGMTEEEAKLLFRHVWIHTFGIGALCAARVCDFSDEEINEMLSQDFTAMMLLVKSGALGKTVVPVPKGGGYK